VAVLILAPQESRTSKPGVLIVSSSGNCMDTPPLWKRGVRGDLKVTMLRYNKNLKGYSRSLRENMTEAEKLWFFRKKVEKKLLRVKLIRIFRG